jgi:hypothetical protein
MCGSNDVNSESRPIVDFSKLSSGHIDWSRFSTVAPKVAAVVVAAHVVAWFIFRAMHDTKTYRERNPKLKATRRGGRNRRMAESMAELERLSGNVVDFDRIGREGGGDE